MNSWRKIQFRWSLNMVGKYKGKGVPVPETCDEEVCYQLDVALNDEALGIIRCAKSGWKMDGVEQELVDVIGEEILAYYE